MKQLLFICCIAGFAACNNAGDKAKSADSTAAPSKAALAPSDYPYTLEKPYANWQYGDQQNAVIAMKALKAFENNDLNTSFSFFGDSVRLAFDGFHEKLSHDSLVKMLTGERAKYEALKIQMQDWEPVISEDKKEEWVTLWYKQYFTNKGGKPDSLAVIDDIKMEKGKIVVLDEKVQRYH